MAVRGEKFRASFLLYLVLDFIRSGVVVVESDDGVMKEGSGEWSGVGRGGTMYKR